MTDEPDRVPNPAAVMANRAALIENLRLCLLSKAGPEEDIITLQSRYVIAMREFAQFLTKAGEWDLAIKIMVLQDALRSLRYGTPGDRDLLQPAKGIGRGPDGIVPWSLREDVDIGLECFLISRKFKTKEKAAKYIADKYPVFDRLKRNPRASLATSILSWRRRIEEGKVPEAEAVLAYRRSFFEQYRDLPPTEMSALGERRLAEAAENTTKAITPIRTRAMI